VRLDEVELAAAALRNAIAIADSRPALASLESLLASRRIRFTAPGSPRIRSPVMFTSLGFASVLAVYFLPFIVALLRSHNPGGVFVVNLLLGWTLIGWAVALVMACGWNGRRRRIRA
jgi:hypothetical protein